MRRKNKQLQVRLLLMRSVVDAAVVTFFWNWMEFLALNEEQRTVSLVEKCFCFTLGQLWQEFYETLRT